MIVRLLKSAPFYATLLVFDKDLADSYWRTVCPFCGLGVLHRSNYTRKPVGHPPGVEAEFDWNVRFSLCCADECCRRRVTPASARFLGRRHYLGVIVTLVTAMAHGLTGARLARLRETLHVDRTTLERWRRWWRETFTQTAFWRAFRGRLAGSIDEGALPGSLWDRFGRAREGVLKLLDALGPVTTATCPVASVVAR
jgi:hypothetical protein